MVMNKIVTELILFGLTQNAGKQTAIFGIFLILYLVTLLGNFLILVTIKTSWTLRSPVYFFLVYLSFADACFSATTAPRLIVDALSQKKTISYNECTTQVFAAHFFGCMEIFVLILMALDRYIGICKRLRYTAIMSQQVCGVLVILAWIGSCIHSSAQIFLALRLPFCGPSEIDHCFCDLQPLLKLACMDAYVINLLVVSDSGAISMVQIKGFNMGVMMELDTTIALSMGWRELYAKLQSRRTSGSRERPHRGDEDKEDGYTHHPTVEADQEAQDVGVHAGKFQQWKQITHKVVSDVGATKEYLIHEATLYKGVEKSPPPGPSQKQSALLRPHDSHAAQGLTGGHIAAIGRHSEKDDPAPPNKCPTKS
ncbi:olfactory receptor 4C11-like protein [Camelus ferus]|nr:olfactory receptor 4C11-like protein [Camelus ferus]